MASTRYAAKEATLRVLAVASKAAGADCMSRDRTISFCRELGQDYRPGEPTTFNLKDTGIHSLEVMRCGIVRINRRFCLYTDFGNRAAAVDFKRPKLTVDHAIALWSHPWLGFHHFLSELSPKICRLKESLGDDLGGATLCYPKIHRRYEKEILEMLGIPEKQVIDTVQTGGVFARKLTFVPMAGWFQGNPNVDLLRKQLMPESSGMGHERLYLERKGRRKCLNDGPIVDRCKELGFVVVDESSRTIKEQIALYRDAKILVGPHGSAFTNMIWAPTGARIIEFIPTTFNVHYHEHLAKSLGHHHTRITCDNGPTAVSGVEIDFTADVPAVLREIENAVRNLSQS